MIEKSKSIDESVLACNAEISGRRLVEFWNTQKIYKELQPLCLDYMRIYQNVMEKNPTMDMDGRMNQTYSQLVNLYHTKETQKNILESEK